MNTRPPAANSRSVTNLPAPSKVTGIPHCSSVMTARGSSDAFPGFSATARPPLVWFARRLYRRARPGTINRRDAVAPAPRLKVSHGQPGYRLDGAAPQHVQYVGAA